MNQTSPSTPPSTAPASDLEHKIQLLEHPQQSMKNASHKPKSKYNHQILMYLHTKSTSPTQSSYTQLFRLRTVTTSPPNTTNLHHKLQSKREPDNQNSQCRPHRQPI
ncbi:hypothetical protein Drorol1_Dr00000615 [Drosera rotundifolia]